MKTIKLTNASANKFTDKTVYLNPDAIQYFSTSPIDGESTIIWLNTRHDCLEVKETPEEIQRLIDIANLTFQTQYMPTKWTPPTTFKVTKVTDEGGNVIYEKKEEDSDGLNKLFDDIYM